MYEFVLDNVVGDPGRYVRTWEGEWAARFDSDAEDYLDGTDPASFPVDWYRWLRSHAGAIVERARRGSRFEVGVDWHRDPRKLEAEWEEAYEAWGPYQEAERLPPDPREVDWFEDNPRGAW